MSDNLTDISAGGEKMRNAVRISFLAIAPIALLLFAAPAAHAWCYEAGLSTVCQGDSQQTSKNISVFKNEYGVFGYNFVREYDKKAHWYEERFYVLPLDCCSHGRELYTYYLDQGLCGWKEFVEGRVRDGDVGILRNAFAYANIYSTKEKDLLLAEAMLYDAKHLDFTIYMYRDDADAQTAIKYWRVEAEENRKLANEL